jgi:Domain of unknown function (DUF4136)
MNRFASSRIAIAGLVLATLHAVAGCASGLTAQVTSFHRLAASGAEPGGTPTPAARTSAPPPLAGRSFEMRPSPDQQGSLEFDRYASLVRQALIEQGLVDRGPTGAGSIPAAELAVDLRYSATSSSGRLTGGAGSGGGVTIGSGVGGGSSFGVGIGLGFPIVGSAADRVSYRHELRVTIERSGAAESPRVFEGQVVSEDSAASLASVMPALVRALFQDFPGVSGVSRVVSVPLDEAPGGAEGSRPSGAE